MWIFAKWLEGYGFPARHKLPDKITTPLAIALTCMTANLVILQGTFGQYLTTFHVSTVDNVYVNQNGRMHNKNLADARMADRFWAVFDFLFRILQALQFSSVFGIL